MTGANGSLAPMSEMGPRGGDPAIGTEVESAGGSERTGVPAVDRVLSEIESVGTLPVAERVAVFERAHEQLRRALDADPTADVAGR